MIKKISFFIFFITNIVHAQSNLQQGMWRGVLTLNDSTQLPFNFLVKGKTLDIINAEEKISVDEIYYAGDSVFIRLPVFDSEIRAKFSSENVSGNFFNHARKDKNVVPFEATKKNFRFSDLTKPAYHNMSGRWEVNFAGDEAPLNISIGEFKQNGNQLTGTFLTSTGDYRYLEGQVSGGLFSLSCFDGAHLFLFTGFYNNDGTLTGHFYSGKHFHDTWTAKRNENVKLPDEDSLTFLNPGFEKINFSFPDADSNMISLSDKKFQNKIIIIQIMGTWCPNCMDETEFLSPFYKKYREKDLEIIGLDFERITEFPRVKLNLERLKKRFGIDYTLLFAGSTDTDKRNAAFPMLNKIIGFPTTIFIDKKGKVRRIHTGYSGPATGVHYEKWQEDFYNFVNMLVNEKF